MGTFSDWLGSGLLISTGKKWHQRRKIITPAFHFKILVQFVEVMNEHGDIFVNKLKNLNGKEIDVFPYISLYALDVICGKCFYILSTSSIIFLIFKESAMGYELNSQTNGESEYAKTVKK